ncbi:MAG: phage portal protein [Intestinimonas sp.]|jgi:hypothetical protein|nr:phage portal protein [Intestinimonas sp.]
MSSLNAFLHPKKVENRKIVVSSRFVEDGKPVAWEIRPITEKENSQLEKKYTMANRKTGVERLDRDAYAHALVAAAVVFPDLTNTELQKGYNVLGEVNLLKEMLTIGEFAVLSEAISELSGLDRNDINEQMEDVKNGSGRATLS